MPDQSDVEAALALAATSALYPDGVAAPPAIGALCRIYRGYPVPASLNADLLAGRVNVTVTPVDKSYVNTTRHLPSFLNTPAIPDLAVATIADTVTFAGTAGAGQLAGVLVDGRSYVYRTAAGDTPAVVAANLAALVRADRPATLSGRSISFPGIARLVARTVADTPDLIELRRQTQDFRLAVWAPGPALRDAAGARLDTALAALPALDAAGVACPLRANGSNVSDQSQSAGLYRRDLLFTVEYPTTATVDRPAMLFGTLSENGAHTLV